MQYPGNLQSISTHALHWLQAVDVAAADQMRVLQAAGAGSWQQQAVVEAGNSTTPPDQPSGLISAGAFDPNAKLQQHARVDNLLFTSTTSGGKISNNNTTTTSAAHGSRYESQKRRDWNTFCQYLRNHRPPLALARCSGAHVLEFLRYLDQFGKTKVHAQGCQFFGHSATPATISSTSNNNSTCACPLRQAWGSLDALIGRLRAAFHEHHGSGSGTGAGNCSANYNNPFAARAIRLYLRDVRDIQAKARGIPYQKKKRKLSMQQVINTNSTDSRGSSPPAAAPINQSPVNSNSCSTAAASPSPSSPSPLPSPMTCSSAPLNPSLFFPPPANHINVGIINLQHPHDQSISATAVNLAAVPRYSDYRHHQQQQQPAGRISTMLI